MAIQKIQRNNFGVDHHLFPVSNLNAMQQESYQLFWKKELSKILQEFSPIVDTSGGRWQISLGPDFYLEADPSKDEYKPLLESSTYSAPLYINVTVENLVTKEKKNQRVFVGNVPLMTRKGNFIINGVQKIVVSQLVKSPGLLYMRDIDKGNFVYTARIIPSRGIWVDLEIGSDNVIYARIDRKKKFPATQLLKLFGTSKEQDIINLFKDVDVDEKVSYIQSTLEKDSAFGVEDAVNSIYKKIRPGDIVSIEQGRKYILSLFEDGGKYDFGSVGRYKFDHRLQYESKPEEGAEYKKTLSVGEVTAAIKELIRMAVEREEPDNIDSLSNRRVRGVGEWLGNTFKAGLSRVVRNTKDKMTLNEDQNFTPAQLVNMRPLAAMVEDFFNTSQLSRFMDQTNLLSEMDQRQFMTCAGPGGLTRERAGFEVRDVQPSYYGRICPVNTPEGPAFGLNLHAAIYSKVNKMGFLETPYLKIKHSLPVSDKSLISRVIQEDIMVAGKRKFKAGQLVTEDVWEQLNEIDQNKVIKVKTHVSQEVVWLSSEEESRYIIAENVSEKDELGHFLYEAIGARKEGNPVQVNVEEVEYMDVASNQIFSLSTCMVPFVAQTDGSRVLMGTNQQGQALPLVKPEQPIVATGFEKIAADYSGYMFTSECDGTVLKADGAEVIVSDDKTKEKFYYKPLKFLPSNGHSTINQRVRVHPGEKVKKGDVLVEGFGIHNGEFAIGQNVRVAFLPFKGYNFEDAIVLSEKLVQKDKFTSTHIYELVCDVHETRLGNEEITRDIPNVATDKLRKLDKDGIIHLGAYVDSGDILVGKITPKGEVDLSPEDKLIRVLFGEYSRDVKDSSLYLEHGLNGKVISIRTFSRANGDTLPNDVLQRVHIWLATTRKIKLGDKMAGRHGNKGVVSVVLPVADMPYTADGVPVDVILNPLGVIGRMNLGQLLETHLGLVCNKQNLKAITQPLNEIPAETIKQELVQSGYSEDGKVDLWDGETGEKYDRPVVVGYLYLNKLHHLVDDKIHTRSTGPYSLVTQQPLGGRSHSGGQRFGEMEVWALEAYGAAHALQEMLTIKSDDVKGRDAAFEAIVREKPIMSPNLPSSFIVLANELTSLGIKVNAQVTETADQYDRHVDESLALSVDEGNLDR
ncbi:MAG: DNA-directed RNA polymerase subunit beta [Patescibacteria group bacterium]